MIGMRYWSTGITIGGERGCWSVWLEFLDDGWLDLASTEGTLRVRYTLDTREELERAIDTLIADAERLGIEWITTVGCPTVYAKDSEDPGHEQIANEQAERLGWSPAYRVGVASGG
jgi:hypothetical protein